MGDSLWQGDAFLVNATKTFIFILAVNHIIFNTKVGEIISFRDFFSKRLCSKQ